MRGKKQKIIDSLCYTDLVYGRINKKLSTNLSHEEIELLLDRILRQTDEKFFAKCGKNYYVTNTKNNIIITINSSTFRVITVEKLRNE